MRNPLLFGFGDPAKEGGIGNRTTETNRVEQVAERIRICTEKTGLATKSTNLLMGRREKRAGKSITGFLSQKVGLTPLGTCRLCKLGQTAERAAKTRSATGSGLAVAEGSSRNNASIVR